MFPHGCVDVLKHSLAHSAGSKLSSRLGFKPKSRLRSITAHCAYRSHQCTPDSPLQLLSSTCTQAILSPAAPLLLVVVPLYSTYLYNRYEHSRVHPCCIRYRPMRMRKILLNTLYSNTPHSNTLHSNTLHSNSLTLELEAVLGPCARLVVMQRAQA